MADVLAIALAVPITVPSEQMNQVSKQRKKLLLNNNKPFQEKSYYLPYYLRKITQAYLF